MATPFKFHDTLRIFIEISQYNSFSDAAAVLNMTKGAISYQIKVLELELGLRLFDRNPRGVTLTPEGRQLVNIIRPHFQGIETAVANVQGPAIQSLTVGMSSYFASRWLSPHLMGFMQLYPEIQLRIQPMTNQFDLRRQGIDVAIRWGNGEWADAAITPFMPLSAWPVGNRLAADSVDRLGLKRALSEFTLLRDHDGSNAWSDWFTCAGLWLQTRKDALIIPDPNVRVQAVIDGQGIALNDALVAKELENGQLYRLAETELSDYGYFIARPLNADSNSCVDAFVSWLQGVDKTIRL